MLSERDDEWKELKERNNNLSQQIIAMRDLNKRRLKNNAKLQSA